MKKVAGFHSFDFGFFWLFSFDLLSGFGIMDFQKDTSTTGIELEKRTPRWMDRSDANRAMEIRRPAGSKSSLERACKLILSGRKGRREIEGGEGLGVKRVGTTEANVGQSCQSGTTYSQYREFDISKLS